MAQVAWHLRWTITSASPITLAPMPISFVVVVQSVSRVWLFATLWIVVRQAPLQARKLEWVAISFSRGSSRTRGWTCVSFIGRWTLHHWTTWEAWSVTFGKEAGIIQGALGDRREVPTIPDSTVVSMELGLESSSLISGSLEPFSFKSVLPSILYQWAFLLIFSLL